jgi:ATP-binding cassette subfamily B protein
VALIGENGQGKTTMVKLITRLYDPTEGQILLDGVDLREYDLAALHSEIGVIFQDFMRYEMTARENIAVGRIEVQHSQEEIEYAADKSLWPPELLPHCLEDTTRCLAAGLKAAWTCQAGNGKSWLWPELISATHSCSFSTNPPPHSMPAVNSKSSSAFAELTFGKMALLISHRFSTVRMADRIVVLEGRPPGGRR